MSRFKRNRSRSSRRIALVLGLALLGALSITSAASASPALKVTLATPDHVTPGNGFVTFVNIQNVGDQPLDGELAVKTTFPVGVAPGNFESFNGPAPLCQTSGQVVDCFIDVTGVESGVQLRYRMDPVVEADASGPLTGGQIEVSGGGASGSLAEPLSWIAAPAGPFAVRSFEVGISPTVTGLQSTRAGSDPMEITTTLTSLSEAKATFGIPNPLAFIIAPTEQFRDVTVHVPPGLIGNPTATLSRCTLAELVRPVVVGGVSGDTPACPPESQVGLAQLNTGDIVGVYNLLPPPGYPAAFGFIYSGTTVTLLAKVRPSDNGIDIVAEKSVNSIPLPRVEVSLWGVPSDPSHDHLRGACLQGGGGYNTTVGDCALNVRNGRAFLRMPTSCPGAPLPWSVEMDTYQHVGEFVHSSTTTPAMEGCEEVPFDPAISLSPSEPAAHSPSGLEVDLTIPQNSDPEGLAESDLKSATVTLPEGFTINPPSADGLGACADGQLRLGLYGPAQCPEASKLGTVEVITPLLDHPIGGTVFLRSQASSDPKSGDLYRLAIELRSDADGIAIKLPGSLVANEQTGQLTASFRDLPQLPFEAMHLQFKTGPRAPLTTPNTCGAHTTHAELIGWNGAVRKLDSSFTLDKNCEALPFAPGFQAGVSDARAGAFSPFSLRITRQDGEPDIARINTTLPEGELAKLAGVEVCEGAALTTGDCPASSRVGRLTVGVGTGPNPLYLPQPGKAPTAFYLAGPYKGAPYSLLLNVPAQAGPFDLGTLTVRAQLRIDPETTQASAISDPLPQIVGGIPISDRDVRIHIDRPGFTLNPTDCEPKAVTGTIVSRQGQDANVSDRFQVNDCRLLGFKPKLSLRLKGGTQRSDHPALRATLRMPAKGANIARVSVALPHSEFLAQNHIRTICTRVQFTAGEGGGAGCPKGSVYGRATAYSPLLDRPLSGPVYLRSSNNPLPDLVAALDGQIHVDLVGRIDTDSKGGIRTTFDTVPDAPVSKFVLRMQGGKKGLLENSTDLCRRTKRATAKFDGQNGKFHDFHPVVKAKCGKGKRGAGRGGR